MTDLSKLNKLSNALKKATEDDEAISLITPVEVELMASLVPYGVQLYLAELDLAIGRPGLPGNKILEFYGFEACGKTTAALQAIVGIQRAGGAALFIDSERTFDKSRAQDLGVNTDALLYGTSDSIEGTFRLIEKTLDTLLESEWDKPFLIVNDSITAVPTEFEADRVIEKEERIGGEAKAIRRGLKHITPKLAKTKASVIFINHNVAKVVMFGKQSQSAGGHGIKFWASGRVEFTKLANLTVDEKGTKRRIGDKIQINVEKVKFSPLAYPKFELELLLSKGFDRNKSLLNALETLGIVKRPNKLKVYEFIVEGGEPVVFREDAWAETMETLGGFYKVYDMFTEKAKSMGLLKPWGDNENSNV